MSKKIIAGLGVVAALGVAVAPVFRASAETTYLTATVDTIVGCTSQYNAEDNKLNFGNIVAGNKGTGTFTIQGTTNKPAGFTLTGTPSAMASADDSIAYSATEVADGAEGWYVTNSEAGATIGNTIVLNSGSLATDALKRNNTWTIGATVSTATTTTTGTYNGTITWTCIAN